MLAFQVTPLLLFILHDIPPFCILFLFFIIGVCMLMMHGYEAI
jgi:hypothetical protein